MIESSVGTTSWIITKSCGTVLWIQYVSKMPWSKFQHHLFFSTFQFPHLYNGDSNATCLIWLLGGQHCVYACVCAKSLQSCQTLCNAMDCSPPDSSSPPGSSVHGILQARTREWVAMSSSRGTSRSKDRTQISYISPSLAGRFFTTSTTWEVPNTVPKGYKTVFGIV